MVMPMDEVDPIYSNTINFMRECLKLWKTSNALFKAVHEKYIYELIFYSISCSFSLLIWARCDSTNSSMVAFCLRKFKMSRDILLFFGLKLARNVRSSVKTAECGWLWLILTVPEFETQRIIIPSRLDQLGFQRPNLGFVVTTKLMTPKDLNSDKLPFWGDGDFISAERVNHRVEKGVDPLLDGF